MLNFILEKHKEGIMAKEIRRCTKAETKDARRYAHEVLTSLSKEMKEIDEKISYYPRRVGSASTNTIVFDNDGSYDLDYQLIIWDKTDTRKPTYLHNSLSNGAKRAVKYDNCEEFQNSECVKVADSTSVITISVFENIEKKKLKFSIDLAIVGYDILKKDATDEKGKSSIIRRNAEGDDQHHYTWNELPSRHSQAYDDYANVNLIEKLTIRDNVVKRKIEIKEKNEKYKSFIIFIEEVNKLMGK